MRSLSDDIIKACPEGQHRHYGFTSCHPTSKRHRDGSKADQWHKEHGVPYDDKGVEEDKPKDKPKKESDKTKEGADVEYKDDKGRVVPKRQEYIIPPVGKIDSEMNTMEASYIFGDFDINDTDEQYKEIRSKVDASESEYKVLVGSLDLDKDIFSEKGILGEKGKKIAQKILDKLDIGTDTKSNLIGNKGDISEMNAEIFFKSIESLNRAIRDIPLGMGILKSICIAEARKVRGGPLDKFDGMFTNIDGPIVFCREFFTSLNGDELVYGQPAGGYVSFANKNSRMSNVIIHEYGHNITYALAKLLLDGGNIPHGDSDVVEYNGRVCESIVDDAETVAGSVYKIPPKVFRSQCSRYATNGGPKEVVPEAFQDVIVNGDMASFTNKLIVMSLKAHINYAKQKKYFDVDKEIDRLREQQKKMSKSLYRPYKVYAQNDGSYIFKAIPRL